VHADECVFVLVLVGAALAVGSVHVPVLLVVAALTMLAAVLTLRGQGLPGGRLPPFVAIAALLALYSVLQAIPLPVGLLARLSPVAADIWGRALLPTGARAPAFASISLDPGASCVEALKWWTYGLIFLCAANFGARRGITAGAVLVLGSAVLIAGCTIAHGLLGATRVFGIYAPSFGGTGWGVGPLLNGNNLASYLNLGTLAGLGLIACRPAPFPRWLIAVAVATLVSVTVNTGSRGGVVALIAGGALFAILLQEHRRFAVPDSRDRRGALFGLGLAVGVAILFTLLSSSATTARLLSDRNIKKLEVAMAARPMVEDFPWFGVGRGAFESVFSAYRLGADNTVYSHPENFVVQWVTEWGLPVGIALLCALGWLLRPSTWATRRSAAACGLLAGFAAFFLHNVVDLGTETVGVAVMVWTIAGVVWGNRTTTGESSDPFSRKQRLTLAGSLAGGFVLLACASAFGLSTVGMDRTLVRASRPADAFDPVLVDDFEDVLQRAIRRHPAEPFFPREGAVVAMQSRRQNPVPWVQRALERAVTSGRTHYLAARMLGARGLRHQALLELRLAVTYDPGALLRPAGILATRITRAEDELLLAAPDGPAGAGMLNSIAHALPRAFEDIAFRILEECTRRDERALGAQVTLVNWLLRDLEVESIDGRCGGDRRLVCQKVVLEHIKQMAAVEPESQDPISFEARLFLAVGRPAAAASLLGAKCTRLQPRNRCMNLWLQAVARTHDLDELHRVAKLVERDGCADARQCAATYSSIGDLLSRVQNLEAALEYYERAAKEEPTRQRWSRIGQVASAVGMHAEAVRAFSHAQQMDSTDPEVHSALEQERMRAFTETLIPKKK
jgi:tetratricopeptide (TPR) repeat protein